MTKHSKNNTASSTFSYAEYRKLEAHYGTKKQRLGQESMRPFDSCSLCLQTAREPVSCNKGHLFCKECVYSDLLSQKKDAKREKDRAEARRKEEEEKIKLAREEARNRVLDNFEKGAIGVGSGLKRKAAEKEAGGKDDETRNVKRRFEFDSDYVEKLAREAEDEAMKQIEAEQAEAKKAKLPDFWLPSLTPDAPAGPIKEAKLQSVCHSSTPPHPLSLKNLIPVNFSFESSNSKQSVERKPMCPSCKKTFSNTSLIFLVKSCSHVLCKSCVEELVKPSKQCVVCDSKAGDKDVIELKREGTGYAGGGLAETSKAGVSFQG